MTASRIVFSLSNIGMEAFSIAIGTQSWKAAGEIKMPPSVMKAALFRGSEYVATGVLCHLSLRER
ncbi:hypothetical protein ACTGJ9_010850 [Bradyrhizobium sp. RDM12]